MNGKRLCVFVSVPYLQNVYINTYYHGVEMDVPVSGGTLFVANNIFDMSLWNISYFIC